MVRVLLVEDSDDRYAKIKNWISDDVRLIWVTCAGSALGVLQHDGGETYAGIMLDFDLYRKLHATDRMPGTGVDVARKVIEKVANDTPILVHSMNQEERYRIVKMLIDSGFDVTQIPMQELTKEALDEWLKTCREIHLERIAS